MSNKTRGPFSEAAQEAAVTVFAGIQQSIVEEATTKAQADVKNRFQEAFELALARLAAAARTKAYADAYAEAIASVATLIPEVPVPATTETKAAEREA